ncbi:DNA-directed RNA polymerase subunit omega [bacterium]|nr:DNA-directed RNA polymerase subunit omega [bacterium]MBU1633846.1 DNA-directed RNA polymerase subunit omega [bacterium]MBU1872933.1 DNA-directed RNA polymerase subunit omega [bacterium]
MTRTLDFSKLTEKTDDLYELIVAASKRARQIAAIRIARDPLPTLGEGDEETFDETPDEEEMRDWDRVEKPVTTALDEMLDDNLEYRYTSVVVEEHDHLEDIEGDIED